MNTFTANRLIFNAGPPFALTCSGSTTVVYEISRWEFAASSAGGGAGAIAGRESEREEERCIYKYIYREKEREP